MAFDSIYERQQGLVFGGIIGNYPISQNAGVDVTERALVFGSVWLISVLPGSGAFTFPAFENAGAGQSGAAVPTGAIQYAVMVDCSDYSPAYTDPDHGFVDGVLRTITGRPGYDGAPTYPVDENGADITDAWAESQITRKGLGRASRRIGIETAGNYGTLSGWSFKLRNDMLIWKDLADNDVSDTNAVATFFVVIPKDWGGVVKDTFFQVWTGVVSKATRTATEYVVSCGSDFQTRHGNVPGATINKSTLPNAPDESQGDAVPVVFGDVPYSPIKNVSGDPAWSTLNRESSVSYDFAPAAWYEPTFDFQVVLDLVTEGVSFAQNDLAGHYIFPASGGGDPDTDTGIKILSSDPTAYSALRQATLTRVRLAQPLRNVTVADFQSSYRYNPLVVNTIGVVWVFRVGKFSIENAVSENAISGYGLGDGANVLAYSFSSEENRYREVPFLVTDSAGGAEHDYTNLSLLSPPVTSKSGDTVAFAPYYPRIIHGSLGTLEPELYDLDRTTTSIIRVHQIELTDLVLSDDVQDIFLNVDLDVAATAPFYLRFGVTGKLPFANLKTPEYELFFPGESEYELSSGVFNFLPNEYYSVQPEYDTNGEASLFDKITGYGGAEQYVTEKVKLPDDLVEFVKSMSVQRLIVTVSAIQAVGSGTITVKQVGVMLARKVNVAPNDVYVRVSGELVDGNETNTVYRALQHLCQTFDGMVEGVDVDYGNLPTARHDWHVGRTLTQQKKTHEYIKELCRHSFVGAFPSRKGVLTFRAWRDVVGHDGSHDDAVVVRDSIKSVKPTGSRYAYNDFWLLYSWSEGHKAYQRSMYLTKAWESSYPTDSTWTEYFGGVPSGQAVGAALWEIAHAGYQQIRTTHRPPPQIERLPWFVDLALFESSPPSWASGLQSSTLRYLTNLAEWATVQKDQVEYKLPISVVTVTRELLDKIQFSDAVYTAGVAKSGWLTLVEVDPQTDQFKVRLLQQPATASAAALAISETGLAPTTINESGSQTTQIDEG